MEPLTNADAMKAAEAAAGAALKEATTWTPGEVSAFCYGYIKACSHYPNFRDGFLFGVGLCTTLYCVCKWKSFLLGTMVGALYF